MKRRLLLLSTVLLMIMITMTVVQASILPETAGLAREQATQGVVLLKNESSALPLKQGEKVALFGVGQIKLLAGGGGSAEIYPPYVVSGVDGMRNAANEGRFVLVDDLVSSYKTFVDAGNADEMDLTSTQVNQVAAKADTAVIYICRFSKEGSDRSATYGTTYNYTPYYSTTEQPITHRYYSSYYLTDKEKAMINQVKAAFDKVVVVLNVPGATDAEWIANDANITAAVNAWLPGGEAGDVVADVLTGKVNPSGKLPVTFAKSLDYYLSTSNFGTVTTKYEEDIFVGYRQFETFDPTYSKVTYPFGYGLSYTSFTITPTVAKNGSNIEIQATVKNIGAVAGKEVVQVYFSAPQKGVGNAKLSKPAKELATFGKTNLLAPGQSQTLTLSFPINDMASYDDTGVTGSVSSYVLEAGDYKIFVGNSIKNAGEAGVRYTCNQASKVVSESLSRALSPVQAFRRLEADGSYTNQAALSGTSTPPAYNAPLFTANGTIGFAEVKSDPSLMEAFIAQIPSNDLVEFLCTSISVGGALSNYGVPTAQKTDGPAGIRLSDDKQTWYPSAVLLASTWDPSLVEQAGAQLGKEMLGKDLVWAPSLNIHRNPLCGRNFEYYSEDPLLSGKMAGAMTKGLQSKKKAVTLKHFAANNQEASRTTNNVIASERALREIYLKGFEIAVKDADPWGVMASYNKINDVFTSERYDLITTILRGEWGFNGYVTSDWGGNLSPTAAMKAGNDVRLGEYIPAKAELKTNIANGTLHRNVLERNAKRTLEMILKTTAGDGVQGVGGYYKVTAGRTRIPAVDFYKAASGVTTETVKTQATKPITDLTKQIACMGAGRWVEYKLNITQPGQYHLAVRLSNAPSATEKADLDFYLDDAQTPFFSFQAEDIPTTGYFDYTTLTGLVTLPVGSHTLRVKADSPTRNIFNIVDYSLVSATQLSNNQEVEQLAVNYLTASPYVFIEQAEIEENIATEDKQVSGLTQGRYVTYPIKVSQAGSYLMSVMQMADQAGGTLKLYVDNQSSPAATLTGTEGGTYTTLSAAVTLSEGTHLLKIQCDDQSNSISLFQMSFIPDLSGRIHIPAANYKERATGTTLENVKTVDSNNNPVINPVTDVTKQIGNFGGGKYVIYDIDVPEQQVYQLAIRLSNAPGSDPANLDFYIDDGATPTVSIPSASIPTTGYFEHTVVYTQINLPSGKHTFKVKADNNGRGVFNLIDFCFLPAYQIDHQTNTMVLASRYLSAFSRVTANAMKVGGLTQSRWVDYPINVTEAGDYHFTVSFGADAANATLEFYLDGSPLSEITSTKAGTGEVTLPLQLTQGAHLLRAICKDQASTFDLYQFSFLSANYTERNPEIDPNTTYSYFSNSNGTPTAYVYGKLNNFNVPSMDEYGMNLWLAGEPETSIQLPVMVAAGQPAAAQPNSPFVIKVFGDAIQSDQSYVFQPYVGDTTGEEIPVTFEES